ncbi:MAG: acyltransferase [Pseudomonadota bacterium]
MTGNKIDNITGSHYAALDGLRGFAVLLVMVYHYGLERQQHVDWFIDMTQFGWVGVDLFFVLSGFLITGILLETRKQDGYFKKFLVRRFVRIWPLYYGVLFLFFVVAPLVTSNLPDDLATMGEKQAWFWLYAANWLFAIEGGFNETPGGYFWSLAVEEQFYLFWPILVYYCRPPAVLKVSIGLLLISAIGRFVLVQQGVAASVVYTMTFTHLDGLAIGAILSVLLRDQASFAAIRRWVLPALVVGVSTLAAVRLLAGSWFFWTPEMASFGYLAIALTGGALLIKSLTADPGSLTHGLTTNRFIREAGRLSYGLYILHVPVAKATMIVIDKLTSLPSLEESYLAFALFFVLAFAFAWLAALISWHVFEKQMLKVKKYFEYDKRTTADAS